MRFIVNFIFFGILFYLIYLFFPDAFKTLVSWADQIVAFFQKLFAELWSKIQHQPVTPPSAPNAEHGSIAPFVFRKL